MAIFKSLRLAATITFIVTANAAPQLESRQVAIPGWDYIGCWTDNPGARTLKQITTTNTTAMTVEKCVGFCGGNNFNLAGVEFGQECWCSNAMDNGPPIIASEKCNQACVGNALETCGGPQALSVYRK